MNQAMSLRKRATLIGACAPLLWALMGMLIVLMGPVPSFQFSAAITMVGCIASVIVMLIKKRSPLSYRQYPIGYYLLGAYGLFGFFAFQFPAFKYAPPAEAFIMVNIYPIFLLLLGFLLYREMPRWFHILGVTLGLCGVFYVSYLDGFTGFTLEAWPFLLCGMAASFVWASYSALNRKYQAVPLEAMAGCFLIASLCAFGVHLMVEETIAFSLKQWLIVILIGTVPEGFALYAWSHGVQNGDLRILSMVSYASPILGAFLLSLVN